MTSNFSCRSTVIPRAETTGAKLSSAPASTILVDRMSVRMLRWSALLTGVFRVIVVVPVHKTLCGETDQGRVMHLALQVGAKAFSRGAGGSRDNGQAFTDHPRRDRNCGRRVFAAHPPATRHVIDDCPGKSTKRKKSIRCAPG